MKWTNFRQLCLEVFYKIFLNKLYYHTNTQKKVIFFQRKAIPSKRDSTTFETNFHYTEPHLTFLPEGPTLSMPG